jgi:hypothetical protein
MEIAVPKDLCSKVGHAGDEAQQMVPLEYLVEQYAVKEAAKCEAKPDPAADPRTILHGSPPAIKRRLDAFAPLQFERLFFKPLRHCTATSRIIDGIGRRPD